MNSLNPDLSLELLTVAGPFAAKLGLRPPGPLTIGRRSGHDLVLPDPASRDHAVLHYERAAGSSARWFIMDTNSKHGTRLNGVRLQPMRRYPIQCGDLLEIHPFTLELINPDVRNSDATIIHTVDDSRTMGSTVMPVQVVGDSASASRRQLELLLQCAERIHATADERSLAEAVLDAVVVGTGYRNAAFLRPMTADGAISVVGKRGAVGGGPQPRLSRSLIMQASGGQSVRLSRGQSTAADLKASVISFGIDQALCVPIVLEKTLAGYLYLDNRQDDPRNAGEDAAEFAGGIARMAAMAMANLKRLDLQQRFAAIQTDVAAAAEAQRWVLPPRRGHHGRLSYIGESRPGRLVSGDFFDVIRLDENCIAISLGDVTGKGMEASVLMTAAQGYLHASLLERRDLSRAVRGLNTFIHPRCDAAHFVTLWTAVVDTDACTLTYVDAGHGYAVLLKRDGTTQPLDREGGPPIGIAASERYVSVTHRIDPGDRIIVVSDGFIEQTTRTGAERNEFGLDGVLAVLADVPQGADGVEALFAAVTHHAGGAGLADDATVLLAQFDGEEAVPGRPGNDGQQIEGDV